VHFAHCGINLIGHISQLFSALLFFTFIYEVKKTGIVAQKQLFYNSK
jgi:hypothetical protein